MECSLPGSSVHGILQAKILVAVPCSVTQLCPTLYDPMDCSTQASLPFSISWSLLSSCHCVGNAIQPSHALLHPPIFLLPSIFPSNRVFSNELALCIRWPKYGSDSFSMSPSNEYSGLISFRNDWFDLAVQRTLKSLLQHQNSKASILQHSTFFIIQLSYLYMATGKTIALTIWTMVRSKVLSLLFHVWVSHSFSSKEQANVF